MGCTSSAQNMAPSLANTEKDQDIIEEIDDNQTSEDKVVAHIKPSESNGIKVLPQCDNLDEPSHLDSIDSKLVETTNTELAKDSYANGQVTDTENENENADANNLEVKKSVSEERLSHLEEVVEKVVELYETGELNVPTKADGVSDEKETTPTQGKGSNEEEKVDDVTETQDVEEEAEIASPSQSQSSRATRWEALADIAAELPPSLAVDPLTGQIYALSK